MSHTTHRRGQATQRGRSSLTALNTVEASEHDAFLDDPTAPPSAQAHDDMDSYEQVKRSSQPSARPWNWFQWFHARGVTNTNRTCLLYTSDAADE